MNYSLDGTIIWMSTYQQKICSDLESFIGKSEPTLSNDKLWAIAVPGAWVLMLTEIFRLNLCSSYEPWREPPISWWGVTHAHALYDQPLWSRVTAAKLRTNLLKIPVPEPFLFIHSPGHPWASLFTICAALCSRPQQSTPKKGSTPSSLLHGKANPRLLPAPLAPANCSNMMAEDLHWVSLSLGEPGAGLNERYHQIECNCGSQISRPPLLVSFLNTSALAKQSQVWLQPVVVFSLYREDLGLYTTVCYCWD